MLANYDFVNDDVMAYFKRRLSQAPRDADLRARVREGERPTRARCRKPASPPCEFKCDVLWAQLDALYLAYVVGMIPPGAVPAGMSEAHTNGQRGCVHAARTSGSCRGGKACLYARADWPARGAHLPLSPAVSLLPQPL